MLSFFPRDVLDEILNLIESVSESFPSYSCAVVPGREEAGFFSTSTASPFQAEPSFLHLPFNTAVSRR